MKKLQVSALATVTMLLVATAAMAFTTYPNPGCPDTLSIVRLKSLLGTVNACAPVVGVANGAPGDTVLGVGGIITGFDEIPTGFDIYIQQSAGGPNSGIDVFTHGTNLKAPYGFALGDSIVVEYARVANFSGDVEVEAPNNNFSAPNIVLRKVSSGNPLPPIFTGTTTDLQELPTNATFAPYVSALVQLNGPGPGALRVARTTGLGGTGAGGSAPFHDCLVVRDAAPSDSVYINFLKLTNILPPAVGTYITSVAGVGNKATRGFRIMPRDANDVVDAQPPGVTDAYAIADNKYRVVFDRGVTTASGQNTANYSLASFGTVNSAVMDGSSAAILTVSGTGLSHGDPETITVNGMVGLVNGVTMTAAANPTFIAGVLSTGEMSAPSVDSLALNPCHDKSKFAGPLGQYINGNFGPRSTFTGIVTGIYGNLYYMEDATPTSPANQHRGITVFAPPVALTQGHKYIIAGADEEFYSENEFAAIVYVQDVGTPGVPASIPLTVAVASYDTCDANQNITSARDYLSELVTLSNVKVVQRFVTPTTSGFHVVGPTSTYADTIFIENINTVLGPNSASNPNYPALGSLINVTGVVHYTTNTSSPSFRVGPRSPADITILGMTGVTPTTGKLQFAVYPNPARTPRVSFELPVDSNVEIGVYDVLGRQVAQLAKGRLPAGTYSRAWDGRDASGNAVNAGVYFYRLTTASGQRTTHSVLLGN